jgi:hypothetical protein
MTTTAWQMMITILGVSGIPRLVKARKSLKLTMADSIKRTKWLRMTALPRKSPKRITA